LLYSPSRCRSLGLLTAARYYFRLRNLSWIYVVNCLRESTVNITVNNFTVVIRSWLVPKPRTFGSAALLDYSAAALLLYIYESRGEFWQFTLNEIYFSSQLAERIYFRF